MSIRWKQHCSPFLSECCLFIGAVALFVLLFPVFAVAAFVLRPLLIAAVLVAFIAALCFATAPHGLHDHRDPRFDEGM